MPTIQTLPFAAGGTVTFAENALDIVAPVMPGARGLYQPHGVWTRTEGGRRVLINKLNPAHKFMAPSSSLNPTIQSAALNSLDTLRFVSASTQYLAPNSAAAMAFGGATGYVMVVFKDTATVNSKMLFGNPTYTGASDYVPNFNLGISGATEFIRIVAGNNSTVRQVETSATDLGTSAYHYILWTWNSSGFRLFIDGVEKTLSSTDTNGFTTSGIFDIGRRISTYGDFDLAAFTYGTGDLGSSTYDTQRGQLNAAAASLFAL